MKREQITEIFPGATKEQLDKLMDINGADINSAKGDLDALKTQLTAAQSELQQLRETAGKKPDELQQASEAIKTLRAELDAMKQAETLRVMREKVSTEKKIPASLLTGETEDVCKAQADAILDFARTGGASYPTLRDGGEANRSKQLSTRDRFADWAKDNL